MDHWLIVLLVIAGVVALIFLLGTLSGSIVIWAANGFYKKQEKEIRKEILSGLPMTNCGQCGEKSCAFYAKLWAASRKNPGKCPFMTEEGAEKVGTRIEEQDAFVQERISTRAKDDGYLTRRLHRNDPPDE